MRNLSWNTKWMSIILLDDMPLPNFYDATIEFRSTDTDSAEEMIAFDRMKHILIGQMTGCIFADVDNKLLKTVRKNFNAYPVTLPTEPIDFVVAATIYSKLISVVEGRLEITGFGVSSVIGDEITNWIEYDDLTELAWTMTDKVKEVSGSLPWYLRSDAGCNDILVENKNGWTVEQDKQDWAELGLGWDMAKADAKKDPPVIIKFPDNRWKPKIIDGGLDDKG